MPKVTTEMIKSAIDAGLYPPRHQKGCPKNYRRMLPLQGLARGFSIEKIREQIAEIDKDLPCKCKEQDVLRDW